MLVEQNYKSDGITFGGALLITFIVLKLTDVITWPWLWVLAPLWCFPLFFLMVVVFVFVCTSLLSALRPRRR